MKTESVFPSWRYHKTEPPLLCQTAEQAAKLGSEWSDKDIRQAGVDEKAHFASVKKHDAKQGK